MSQSGLLEFSHALEGFTPGSVLFIGAAGEITEDNANLFWDDVNNRLGLGTVGPDLALEINEATGQCLRLTYNDPDGGAVVYSDLTVTIAGILTLAPTAATVAITNPGADDLITMTDAGDTIDVQINTGGDSYFNGGDVGIGNITPAAQMEVEGDTAFTPSDTLDIVAGTGITATMIDANTIIRVQGSGGAVTITATPSIADGVDGQIVIFQGDSDANSVTFQDNSVLANSDLHLQGNANMTLGLYDTLTLTYDAGADVWLELSRSNN